MLRLLIVVVLSSVLVTVLSQEILTWSGAAHVRNATGSLIFEDTQAGYRFSYPASALLNETSKTVPDAFGNTHLVQFTVNDTSYVISGIYGDKHKTIEQWLQDSRTAKAFPFADYKKITVNKKTAYQWKEGLVTTFMIRGKVFEVIAYEKGAIQPSRKLDDPVYKELLESFQATR